MKFSIFKNGIQNTHPDADITLGEVKNKIQSNSYKDLTLAIREVEQDDLKTELKRKLHHVTFSGVFTQRRVEHLRSFSGYICIDIDDVTDLKNLKKALTEDPTLQPALVFTSPSGTGIKAVYKVEENLDPESLPYTYDYIAGEIEARHGLITDRMPKSVASACFLPWDEEAFLNENAKLVDLPEFDIPQRTNSTQGTSALSTDDDDYQKTAALVSYLEDKNINMADSYPDWLKIGFAFATFGEKGRPLFHRASKISPKYDHAENERQFDTCLNSARGDVTLGTFFHMVGEAGVPSGEVLKGFNKVSIISSKPEDFWSAKNQKDHKERANHLIKDEEHPLVQWVMSFYSITHEQLCVYSIGLGQYTFKDGNIEDALFAPHEYGVRAFIRDGQELIHEDLKGSHVTDSFFGASHTANKSIANVANNPFEAIALSNDPKVDVISPLMDNGSMLGEKQSDILSDIGKYWKKVYVFRGADYGDEEREAREYVRSYSDVLDRETEVYWINPVFEGLAEDSQPIEILAYLSSKDKTPKDVAEYVWNTWTKKYKFWHFTGTRTAKLDLDDEKIPVVLDKIGIEKHYFIESDPTLVICKANTIEKAHNHYLVDYIRENILDKLSKYIDISSEESGSKLISRKKLTRLFNRKVQKFLSEDLKASFRPKPIDLLEDSKDLAYLFYQNGVIKVTKEDVKSVSYSNLQGKIWKNQILDRPFQPLIPQEKGEFEKFFENICGGDLQRKKAFMSNIGYHIHGYKDVGNARALILVDEFSSKGNHAGGTGKGIFAKSVSHIRKQGYIAGKNVDTDSRFLFMNADWGDQSFHFEDVRSNFDFEALFNVITDNMQVERKGKDRFTIPFSQSPKFIISTNHTIQGKGHSFDRRQVFLPFSNYYGPHLTPQQEFGHNLYNDWGEKQWRLFDDFMIRCIQLYLKEGLIIPKSGQFKVRTFTESTSKPFYDWAEEWLENDREYDLRSLFRGGVEMPDGTTKVEPELNSSEDSIPSFYGLHPEVLDLPQAKTFNSWMLEYGEFKGWKAIKRDSNGAVLIKFS